MQNFWTHPYWIHPYCLGTLHRNTSSYKVHTHLSKQVYIMLQPQTVWQWYKLHTFVWSFLLFALPISQGRQRIVLPLKKCPVDIIRQKSPDWKVGTLCSRYLSSQAVARQVLSAYMSLTSVFGMGTGGPSWQSTRTILKAFTFICWWPIPDSNRC